MNKALNKLVGFGMPDTHYVVYASTTMGQAYLLSESSYKPPFISKARLPAINDSYSLYLLNFKIRLLSLEQNQFFVR